jgi:uncharacterized metal-binding protein YceD (DUF177 family)
MIAALMASTNGSAQRSAPKYTDLARAEANIDRAVAGDDCRRLATECISVDPLRAQIRFELDDEGRVRATGEVTGKCTIACQLCLEPKPWPIAAKFSALLATNEEQAQDWVDARRADEVDDVVVTGSETLDLVELIEDEVLLGLPTQVCIDEACPRRPAMDYGDAETAAAIEANRESPFAVLKDLKSGR